MEFRERLKWLKREYCLNQKDIAGIVSLSQQTVSIWERGETLPDASTLIELSRYFKVSVDWLLGMTDDPTPRAVTPEQAAALQALPVDAVMTEDEINSVFSDEQRRAIEAIARRAAKGK